MTIVIMVLIGMAALHVISKVLLPDEKGGVPTPEAIQGSADDHEIVLVGPGSHKIEVIRVIRELTGLGLKEAKDLVDITPGLVRSGLSRADAERWATQLEAAGAMASARRATGAPAADAGFRDEGDALVAVHLEATGDRPIQVIKLLREATGLGLKEAKDLVDSTPSVIATGMPKGKAARLREALEAAGAIASLRE